MLYTLAYIPGPRYMAGGTRDEGNSVTLDEVISALKQRAAGKSAIGARVKVDLGGDGQIMLDGTAGENVISTADGDADCTVTLSLANFAALLEGGLAPELAYLTGRMKISGDMGVVMRMAELM